MANPMLLLITLTLILHFFTETWTSPRPPLDSIVQGRSYRLRRPSASSSSSRSSGGSSFSSRHYPRTKPRKSLRQKLSHQGRRAAAISISAALAGAGFTIPSILLDQLINNKPLSAEDLVQLAGIREHLPPTLRTTLDELIQAAPNDNTGPTSISTLVLSSISCTSVLLILLASAIKKFKAPTQPPTPRQERPTKHRSRTPDDEESDDPKPKRSKHK